MADPYRGAGRFDLRLSGRQAAGIVVGALVTLGITFAIGVGFGHRLAVAPPAGKPGGDEGADGRGPPDAGLKKVDYTYQGELTKTDQPIPPLTPPKLPPKVVVPTPVPPPAPVPHPDAELAAPPVEAAAKPAAEPHASADEEVLKALEKAAPEDKQVAGDDRFAVQFGAPSRREDAERLAAKLAGFGYSPTVTEADIPGKGVFFRVRVGHFATKEDAETFRDEAASENRVAGMVMPSK